MNFNAAECSHCGNTTIDRVPASFIKIAQGAIKENRKVGEITKEHIEAAREDLKDTKIDLKTTEYVSDD